MITPNQIKEKELSTAAHGYDIDEIGRAHV